MEVETFQSLDPESYFRKFVTNNIRPDGRGFQTVRQVSVDTDVLSSQHVQSSALASIGATKAVAGITLQAGQPSESAPECGDLEVQVLLGPLCSSKFGTGRPTEQAQALGSFVKDSIVGSGAILLEDLIIERGCHAWKLCVDIVCVSFDGNITDVAVIAAVAALLRLRLPDTMEVDGQVVVKGEKWVQFPVRIVPLPLTFGLFDEVIITDPSSAEEELVTTQVTVLQTASGQVCSVHKPGGSCVSGKQLDTCLHLSLQHAQRLSNSLVEQLRCP